MSSQNRRDIVEYIVTRIKAGARVRFKHDYFGSPIAEIPKWYGLRSRIPLSPTQFEEVRGRLRNQD